MKGNELQFKEIEASHTLGEAGEGRVQWRGKWNSISGTTWFFLFSVCCVFFFCFFFCLEKKKKLRSEILTELRSSEVLL